ncbi:MAG: hypothetical protein IJX49_06815 [Clostridia bacterium]|nr:hypothetical protein [Clostridia bacterium]
MQTTAYQPPKLWILTFEKEDVIRTSDIFTPNEDEKLFDKGVEDFF